MSVDQFIWPKEVRNKTELWMTLDSFSFKKKYKESDENLWEQLRRCHSDDIYLRWRK